MKAESRSAAAAVRGGRRPRGRQCKRLAVTGPLLAQTLFTVILNPNFPQPRTPHCALRLLALAALLVNLVGCGLFGPRETSELLPEPAPVVTVTPQGEPPPDDDTALLRGHLYEHYKLWKGTPYRMGGLTTRGIDCSGFVLVTFKALLDTPLPRTVDEQATLGRGIVPAELRTGDLVFFKTGAAIRHVGIYLDHGRFMHASTRRGVMISALDDSYWRQRFWQARRLREPLVARAEHQDDTPPARH